MRPSQHSILNTYRSSPVPKQSNHKKKPLVVVAQGGSQIDVRYCFVCTPYTIQSINQAPEPPYLPSHQSHTKKGRGSAPILAPSNRLGRYVDGYIDRCIFRFASEETSFQVGGPQRDVIFFPFLMLDGKGVGGCFCFIFTTYGVWSSPIALWEVGKDLVSQPAMRHYCRCTKTIAELALAERADERLASSR